jgi:acetate kinase
LDSVIPVVLALNSGSSALKFGVYRVGLSGLDVLLSGDIDAKPIGDAQDPIRQVFDRLADAKTPPPTAIGHRVVHGGPALRDHCLIDEAVIGRLITATPFSPLHMPTALSLIASAHEHFAGLPQVACFDTVFHAGMPEVARTLPIAKTLRSEGLERYGFHGLSCESIVRRLRVALPDRLIIAHLGNGASITAVKAGRSIDTSMGLTPTGGVIMGTRSGDLDPGILVYLAREKAFDPAKLEELIDHRSGLLGISGVDSDMRVLRLRASSNADASLAIRMFCYSVRKHLVGMIAALGGLDMIVFTGGIGENDALARSEICAGLAWLGITLDEARNRSADNPLNDAASRCRVIVLVSQEDEQIARHTADLIMGAS